MKKLIFLSFLILIVSCAKKGFPPGGPIDNEPPRVVSVAPDSGAVSVSGLTSICVTFSEPMDRRTVRDVTFLRPQARIRGTDWKKNGLCLLLADTLLPSTTYAIVVMSGCKDSHGNTMRAPFASTFSTGDSVFAGSIEGKVEAKGLPVPYVPIWAFDSLRCPVPNFLRDEADYLSQTDARGYYRLIGLGSGTYLLYAFKDKNGNRAFDEDEDFASPAGEPVTITAEEPTITELNILLADPREPGSVRGVVKHCLPDTVSILVRAVSVLDSTDIHTVTVKGDSTFVIDRLSAREYRVGCFGDLNKNREFDSPEEPGGADVPIIVVFPGEVSGDVELSIDCIVSPQSPEMTDVPEEDKGELSPQAAPGEETVDEDSRGQENEDSE